MPKKKTEENTKAVLETTGLTFEAEGETAEQAIFNLNMTWDKLKAKGVITIIKGKLKAEHLFIMPQLRRVFKNKLTRKLWAERLESMLK